MKSTYKYMIPSITQCPHLCTPATFAIGGYLYRMGRLLYRCISHGDVYYLSVVYRMETFTVSVDIYIIWRRLLYRWIFISHGDVYCISVDIYIAWRRLLYRWVFISHGDVYYRWIFISHGDVYCIGEYLYRMETFTVW
jgi:hypothetical protein